MCDMLLGWKGTDSFVGRSPSCPKGRSFLSPVSGINPEDLGAGGEKPANQLRPRADLLPYMEKSRASDQAERGWTKASQAQPLFSGLLSSDPAPPAGITQGGEAQALPPHPSLERAAPFPSSESRLSRRLCGCSLAGGGQLHGSRGSGRQKQNCCSWDPCKIRCREDMEAVRAAGGGLDLRRKPKELPVMPTSALQPSGGQGQDSAGSQASGS